MKPSTKILAAAAVLLIVIIAAFVILKPTQETPSPAVSTVSTPPVHDTLVIDKAVPEAVEKPAIATVQVRQVATKLPAERFNPKKFLVKNIKTRKNIMGKTVIEGSVSNTSPNMVFKDVAIDVAYLSKTGAVISTQRFVVYEIIQPGKKAPFKFKAKAPEGTRTFSTELIDAAVVK